MARIIGNFGHTPASDGHEQLSNQECLEASPMFANAHSPRVLLAFLDLIGVFLDRIKE
jgi:hypothetical protein